MSNIQYLRICKQFKDFGAMIPKTSNLYELPQFSVEKEMYRSVYTYEQKHYDSFQTAKSVAGVNDIKTNFIFLDYDSKIAPELARDDTLKCVEKLLSMGIKESEMDICFSGMKGFSITFTIDRYLSRQEYTTLYTNLNETFATKDLTVLDYQRLCRVPFTKHQVSGLYKHPITLAMLRTHTVEEFKTLCATSPEEKVYASLSQEIVVFEKTELPILLIPKEKDKPKQKVVLRDLGNLDFKNKIKGLTNCRWAILNGFGERGARHNQYMALCASLKNLNYPQEQAYSMILTADEIMSKRTNEKEHGEEEIRVIVNSVYDPQWKGGQYTCKLEGTLHDYCKSLGENRCSQTDVVDEAVSLDSVLGDFKTFAKNAAKNVLKTGIKALDKRMKFMIGTSSHIVGPPGSGKCLGVNTEVLMWDGSIKLVQNIETGDLLYGHQDVPMHVLSTTKGTGKLYRITSSNYHVDYVVNSDHILTLYSSKTRKFVDMQVEDYLKLSKFAKSNLKGIRHTPRFTEKELPMNAYFLGMFYAGGDITRISEILKDEGLKEVVSTLPLDRIPECIMSGSIEQRRVFLSGALEMVESPAQNLMLKNKQTPGVERDFIRLVNSLGGIAHSKSKSGLLKIRLPNTDYLETRLNIVKPALSPFYSINVEDIGEGDYYGFELDGDGRFLLGDCSVTHNTSLLFQVLEHNSNKGIPSIFFSLDMSKYSTIAAIARRYFTFLPGEIEVVYDGEVVAFPDIEEMIIEHCNQNTEKWKLIQETITNKYKHVKFYFKPSYHIDHMKQAIDDASDKFGQPVKLVVIDYSELVQTEASDSLRASEIVAQQCRHLAIETGTAFITLVQPNKANSDITKEMVSYQAAKGSNAIAQSSQLMLGVSRPGFAPRNPGNDKFMTVAALKNRSGPTWAVDLSWKGEHGMVYDMSAEDEAHLATLRQELLQKAEAEKASGAKW